MKVTICDFTAFSTDATEETEQMDQLYLYITGNSQVDGAPEADIKKMALNIEKFYGSLVEKQLEDYNSRGNSASFEEMLSFLFNLDSREALAFFAEGYAKNEVKNRIVINTLAEKEGISLSPEEYEALKDSVEVSSFLAGDEKEETGYEILRRKVLKAILKKLNY